MALPNELANQLPESTELLTAQDQQAAIACLQEIQAVLEHIQQTREETEKLRAVSEPLLDQLLRDSAQRILARQNEINQLKAEAEVLRARLADA